jgi:Lon protease-like protein
LRPLLEQLLGRIDEARDLAQAVARANQQRTSERATPPVQLSDDLVRATYQLAGRAPIGPVDRYRVLAAPTLETRVELLGAAVDDAEAMLRFRLA